MATDSAGHALIDLVGNTLVVSDIQIASATGAAGTGITGTSVSTNMFASQTLIGGETLLNSTTAPSGGSTTGRAIVIGTGATSSVSINFGAGAPSGFTATQGSIYLNTTGSSVSTRMYINTTGVSTWTAVTTLA
jgi:hypothetical protein